MNFMQLAVLCTVLLAVRAQNYGATSYNGGSNNNNYYSGSNGGGGDCDVCTRVNGNKADIRSLTFRYTGPTTMISVNGLGSVMASSGGELTVATSGVTFVSANDRKNKGGSGSNNKLPTNTVINIGGSSVTVHTSCSQPLFVGQSVGPNLVITGFVSDQTSSLLACAPPAPPPPSVYSCYDSYDDCPAAPNPYSSPVYTNNYGYGGSNGGSGNCDLCDIGNDKPDLLSLSLVYSGPPGAWIRVNNLGGVIANDGGIITVTPTALDYIDAAARKKSSSNTNKLPTNTIFTVNGNSVTLHTSCSQPIFLGQSVGNFLTIVGFRTDQGSDANCAPPPVPDPPPPPPCFLCCYDSADDCPAAPEPASCDVCGPYNCNPQSLTFEIVGGATSGGQHNSYGGVGQVTGNTIASEGPYTVQCTGATSSPVTPDNEFTITMFTAPYYNLDVICTVMDRHGNSQQIPIDVRCTTHTQLVTNELWGAIKLVNYIDCTGAGPSDICLPNPDPPCDLCCDMNPPTIDYNDLELVVECDGEGNTAELHTWLNSFSCSDGETGYTFDYSPNPVHLMGSDCDRYAVVTFMCMDDCMNSVNVTGTFRVIDSKAPVITTPPSDFTAECDGQGNSGDFQHWLDSYGGMVALDDCVGSCAGSGYYQPPGTDQYVPSNPNQGVPDWYTPAYVEGDNCQCTRSDYDQPVCSGGSTYRSLCFAFCNHPGQDYASMSWEYGACPVTSDEYYARHACNSLVYTYTPGSPTYGPCDPQYGGYESLCTEVTFTVTDPCGNSVSASATFVIKDTNPPSITDASDKNVECSRNTQNKFQEWVDNHGGSTAMDSCSGVTWTTIPANPTLDELCNEIVTVTFVATDRVGREARTSANFRVSDTTAPMVITDPQPTTIECTDLNGPELTLWLQNHGGMTVKDDCPNNQTCTQAPPNTNQAYTNNQCPQCEYNGGYADVPVCIDGNRQYSNMCYLWCQEGYITDNSRIEQGECNFYTASDYECTNPIIWLPPDIGPPGPCPGSYGDCPKCASVTFTAKDSCGNAVRRSTRYTITDNTPPVIVQPAQDGGAVGGGYEMTFHSWLDSYGGAQAADGCGNVTWSIKQVLPGGNLTSNLDPYWSGSCPEVVTYVFYATDDCNNVAHTSASFYKKDTTPPDITDGTPLIHPCDTSCGGFGDYWESDAYMALTDWIQRNACLDATDCTAVTWTVSGVPSAPLCGKSGVVTFTAIDESGNSATQTVAYDFSTVPPPVYGSNNEYDRNNGYNSGSTSNNGYNSGSTSNNGYNSGSTSNNGYNSGSTGNYGHSDPICYSSADQCPPPTPPPTRSVYQANPYANGGEEGCDLCEIGGNSKPKLLSLSFAYSGPSGQVRAQGLGSVEAETGGTVIVSVTGVSYLEPSSRKSSGGGSKNNDKLPTNTVLWANGAQVTIHTSCSQPLFLGQQVGQYLTIVGFRTDQGTDLSCTPPTPPPPPPCRVCPQCPMPEVCGVQYPSRPPTAMPTPPPTDQPTSAYVPNCDTPVVCGTGGPYGGDSGGKPDSLTFRYNPSTLISPNTQGSKAKVVGSVGGQVSISCTGNVQASPSQVAVGGAFELSGSFLWKTDCTLVGYGTQTITIITSCKQPLNVGDQFGSLQVIGYDHVMDTCYSGNGAYQSGGGSAPHQAYSGGGTAPNPPPSYVNTPPSYVTPTPPPPPPTPPPVDYQEQICVANSDKIKSLTFEYNGYVNRDSFDPEQNTIIRQLGSPNMSPVVLKIVSKSSGRLAYDQVKIKNLELGTRFTVYGFKSGQFGAVLKFKIEGRLIQFQVNCRAPLAVGDQFGSLKIVDYELL